MKKIISLLLVLVLCVALAACGKSNGDGDTTTPKSSDGYEIALVTDIGTVDDKSFNQGAWEGVKEYAEANNKTHTYYQPSESDTNTLISFIELAINGGAKVVVCPGFTFEAAIYEMQTKYPDVSFILLDGVPHSETDSEGNATYETKSNTYPILYAEEQAGFLAGYAAVKDGMTSLGFLGGMAVPAVKRFGQGYIQGADVAAQEMGVNVSIMYHYTGGFAATPEAQTLAAGWFSNGAEVVFGCGGALGNSAMAAAEAAGKKAIGVDVDQKDESETIITSAMKNLSKSVVDALTNIYNGVAGGETANLDVTVQGVQLPDDFSRFEKFTKADYDEIYAKLVDGSVKVDNKIDDIENDPTKVVEYSSNTTVTFVA